MECCWRKFHGCFLTFKTYGVQRAVIQTSKIEAATYTGVKGNINAYNPEVKEGDSYAQIYVMNGPEDDSNYITTGWLVI